MIAVKFLFAVCLLFLVSCGIMFQAFAQESKIPEKDTAIKEEKINPKVPSETIQANIKGSEERYRIGLHDVLEVTVFKHPELSQPNIRMDETGRIRLPRIDSSILAICKTENELSAEIINLYKQNYLREPYVTVFVKEQNSQPLSVIGAVEKPGNFYTNRRLTLLELLSFAGGQKVEKAGTKIQVARVGGISGCKTNVSAETVESDGVTFFSYVLADVLKGKENPVMRPGDIVVVLEADQVYVTGNVVKQQSIRIICGTEDDLFPGAKFIHDELAKLGIEHEWLPVPGSPHNHDQLLQYQTFDTMAFYGKVFGKANARPSR